MVDLAISCAIDTTLNSMSALILASPIGNSVGSFVTNLFIPSSVWQTILTKTPDAVEVGASVSATLNLRIPAGLTAGGGVELLVSPKTGNDALFTYVGGGLSFGSTATSIGGGGTAGLVFNCPSSSDYVGRFLTVTVPMAAIPANIRTALAGDGLGIGFSENGSLSFFLSPVYPYAFGVSLGLGSAAYSVGPSTSNWSLTGSYYWQDYPDGPTAFE